MKIEQIKKLKNPNVYSHEPALVMRLDLENLTEKESREIPNFNEQLLALIPTLAEHGCETGRAGGFVERLETGTFCGHVVEHVALELSHLADCGIGVNYGRTRQIGDAPNLYRVVVEYKSEAAMKFLLETAVRIVEKLAANESPAKLEKFRDESLAEARSIAADCEFGPSARAIVEAAKARNIPVRRIGKNSLAQLGYGKNRRFVQAALTGNTSSIAVDVSCNKELTKEFLRAAQIPVPFGKLVRSEEAAVAAWQETGSPVVVKPLDGRQGKGVSCNLLTEQEVRAAFRAAAEFSGRVIVEEQFAGENYRVLVIGGKMVAASLRLAPFVTGDGESTIAELVALENQNELRGECHEKPLTKIKLDDIALAHLAKHGRSAEFVPASGERIALREGCNLSTGGTAEDVTDRVHASIKNLCERAARAVGLDICGVDLVCRDIAAPLETGAGVIELNAAPGLRMHTHPSAGASRKVGEAIVEMLYPNDAPARIPLVAVTGTNGKTTVTRMIAHAFQQTGKCVGMTTTDGIWIDNVNVCAGDTTGPKSASVVLSDPTVEVAVLETARGGIVRNGLGWDWADTAVLTNIQPDHIGQDGIADVDDIFYIKSLVAERVREGGTIVLNADDEMLARLEHEPRIKKYERNIVYFSLKPNHITLKRHISAGGTAYTVRGGWLVEATRDGETPIVEIAEIPVALSGFAEFNVANALAAAAALRAENLTFEQIAAALRSFEAAEHNAGRANLYEVDGAYVFLDYGHNPEAFKSICRMAVHWNDGARRITGIIAVPGDRADELLIEAGRIAARGFDRVIVREDADLRGRAAGEAAEIIYRAVLNEKPNRDCRIVQDETEALKREITRLQAGDILVCFYENFAAARDVLRLCDGVPTNAIKPLKTFSHYGLRQA